MEGGRREGEEGKRGRDGKRGSERGKEEERERKGERRGRDERERHLYFWRLVVIALLRREFISLSFPTFLFPK